METKVYLLSLIPFQEAFPKLTKREIEKKAGDYAIRKVFADVFGYHEITICRDGKPYVMECPFHFNLSHSDDYLLLAVGDVPIGADIEKITKIRPKTMEKYFTKAEKERVDKEGRDTFYEIWTKKESYVKYTGEGLKGLANIDSYPSGLSFFTTKYETYQITVCTKEKYLPNNIEMISY